MSEKVMGTIVDPNGDVLDVPYEMISDADARLLREYKRFLEREGYVEALHCRRCFEGKRRDGCEAHVTGGDILIRCRCRRKFYRGGTA